MQEITEEIKIKEKINFKKLEQLGFEKRYSEFTGKLSYFIHPEEEIEIHIAGDKATDFFIHKEEISTPLLILLIKLYKEELIEIKQVQKKRYDIIGRKFIIMKEGPNMENKKCKYYKEEMKIKKCKILNELICKDKKCSFYKTNSMLRINKEEELKCS